MALADPTVRSQELGDELRTLRERAGCTLTSAGQRIDASASKICRIENGHITATPEDVAALLVVYNVTGPTAANSSTSPAKPKNAGGGHTVGLINPRTAARC